MCGIGGYIGSGRASKVLLNALRRLEYRGYDSMGMAVLGKEGLVVRKGIGKVEAVNSELCFEEIEGSVGIAHTRWATNGGVTKENAHPHVSNNGKIVVVHNGIIENYLTLREELREKGFSFSSETDTEVVPNLIEEYMRSGKDFQEAFFCALKRLEGNYAIVCMHEDLKEIAGAKNGSPLVVGRSDEGYFIASDVPAFLEHTNDVCYLEDREVVFARESITFFELDGGPISKGFERISWTLEQAEKGNYEHFMLKEIMEQQETIVRSVEQDIEKVEKIAKMINEAKGTFFVACGTACYASQVGDYLFSHIAKKHVNVVCGSEFPNYTSFLNPDSLLIVVSQSGETTDTIEAVKAAREKGVKVVAIVNVMGSTLMRMADEHILTNAGPEIGVASTKATTAQISLLMLLAYASCGKLEEGKKLLLEGVEKGKGLFSDDFLRNIKRVAEEIVLQNHLYVIGRATNYPVALEAAHKIKEVSYIHAEGMAGGELKHGTIALIDKGTPCIVIAGEDSCKEEILGNAREIAARGGKIIGIAPFSAAVFDEWIEVPECGNASAIFSLIPAQLLAYYLAVLRECDPDKPRNLAKSVTVK